LEAPVNRESCTQQARLFDVRKKAETIAFQPLSIFENKIV